MKLLGLPDWWLLCATASSVRGAPSNRYGHAMAAGDGQLWVFGGSALVEGSDGGSHHEANELWRYNASGKTWALIQASSPPPPRLGHRMVSIPANSWVLVFGGRTAACVLGDLWRLQLGYGPGYEATWERLTATGAAPGPRFSHAMQEHPTDNSFWLHGGVGGGDGDGPHNSLYGDLWNCRIGTASASWQRVGVGGPRPSARASHALAFGSGHLWLHGGFGAEGQTKCFNIEEGYWHELQPGPPRQGHVAFFTDGFFWIYGSSGSSSVSDMFRYDQARDRWASVNSGASRLPESRTLHAAAFAEGTLWLHGGTPADNRSASFGDLWSWPADSGDWSLLDSYNSLGHQHTRNFVVGWAISSALFCAVAVIALPFFTLRTSLWKASACCLCWPFAWSPRRRADFATTMTLAVLGLSLPVITAMAFARWMASPGILALDILSGPATSAAYGVTSVTLLCCFRLAMSIRTPAGSAKRQLADPMHLALFLLEAFKADIRLVRLEFLRELHESRGVWPRRQEAEKMKTRSGWSALLSHAEVVTWAKAMLREPQQQRVISVSHMWEAPEHPDPFGFQSSELVGLLEDGWRRDPTMIVGVFIDFMSLYQFRRQKHQEKAFQRALCQMHLLYVHDWTHTVSLTGLTPWSWKDRQGPTSPQLHCELPGSDVVGLQRCQPGALKGNSTEYLQRGWCLAELQWSCLRSSRKFGQVLGTASFKSQQLLQKAPKSPTSFRYELEKTCFSQPSDFFLLVSAHGLAFQEQARELEILELESLPEAEVDILADALQPFQALEQLELSRCGIGAPGLALRLTWLLS
eukprot:s4861_g2.t2